MDYEKLKELVDKGLSQRQIAEELNVGQTTVRYCLAKYELKTRRANGQTVDDFFNYRRDSNGECLACGRSLRAQQRTYCSIECQADYQFLQKLVDGEPTPEITALSLKRWLLRQRGHQCEVCKLTEWLDQPIPLEMHHIDGDAKNNTFANLQLICPNCHALTETYKAKNTGNGRAYRRERYKNGQSY